jgi:hypothetical protein
VSDYSGEVWWWNQVARNEPGQILHPNYFMLAQAVSHCEEEARELRAAEQALERRLAMTESIDESLSAVAEVADGALDLIYVAFNVLHAIGVRPRPLWAAIHKANLAKIPDCQECNGTGVSGGIASDEMDCSHCDGLGKLPPIRNEQGKVLKPAGWQPPDLIPLLRQQLRNQS